MLSESLPSFQSNLDHTQQQTDDEEYLPPAKCSSNEDLVITYYGKTAIFISHTYVISACTCANLGNSRLKHLSWYQLLHLTALQNLLLKIRLICSWLDTSIQWLISLACSMCNTIHTFTWLVLILNHLHGTSCSRFPGRLCSSSVLPGLHCQTFSDTSLVS